MKNGKNVAETVNALTVDLEDWYHVCGDGDYSDPGKWDTYENRVTVNTEKILDMLRGFDCKATFFVLGYIAEKNPLLIEKLREDGHEIAVHGYFHRRIFDMTPEEFEEDIERSVKIVEAIAGGKVLGYRAPEWSMQKDTLWALDVIRKVGLLYDSSMVPLTRMGENFFKRFPHTLETRYGALHEFPLTTVRCFWENLPVTGGLPMRIAPYWYILESIKRLNKDGLPALVYIHPWEFDDKMPIIELPFSRRFMHYFNIRSTKPKLNGLLEHLKFAPIKEILELH